MDYLKVGTIIGTFNLDGELRVYSTTYFPLKRFKIGNTIYTKKDEVFLPLTVENYIDKGAFYLIKFKEINSIDEAIKFKGFELFVKKDDTLDKGFYYFADLENCDVIDENNNELGKVIKVEEFPAQITLRVQKPNGKSFFVPFISQFILSVDIKNKLIKIKVIPGLL